MTEKNKDRRYIGKVKEMDGKFGKFSNIVIDNPDISNEFSKGSLIWVDKETGDKFLVKSLALRGIYEDALAKGFTNSVAIDLNNEYQVKKID